MVWGNPPAAIKSSPCGPSTLRMQTDQFPSLGAASAAAGPPNGRSEAATASGSATQFPTVAPPKRVAKPTLAHVPDPGVMPSYHVTGSKKGGFPVTVEKRPCGKKVTVIRNVVGDRSALLSALKKKLGCGGVTNGDGTIEVQGERQAAVEKFLAETKCLKAVSRANQIAAAPAPARAEKVAEPTKIDKRMAEGRAPAKEVSAEELISVTEKAAKGMKPTELKAHLKAAGLPIQGNKKELLARLLERIK